jgi:hypothetical protein
MRVFFCFFVPPQSRQKKTLTRPLPRKAGEGQKKRPRDYISAYGTCSGIHRTTSATKGKLGNTGTVNPGTGPG